MNWKLLFLDSLRMMPRYRLRTLFMSFGIAIGVATLIAGRSLAVGAEQQMSDRVGQMFGPGTILIFSSTLSVADLTTIEDRLDQVVATAPRFTVGTPDVSYKGVTRKSTVYGHSERADFVWNRGVTEGRFLNSDDLSRTARVALVGPRLVETLFEGRDPIGKEMLIGSVRFEVVGILDPVGIDPHGEDRDEDIFVPITTAMRRLSNDDSIGSAKIVVSNHEMVDEDADQVSAILRERHRIQSGEKDDFMVFTSKYAGRAVIKANRAAYLYVMAAAGIVLLVAAVVISTIMLVVVRERVQEIGLRKAVGATELQIGTQFLAETAVLALISGLVGIAFGIGAATVTASMVDMPAVITTGSIVMALAASVAVGIVSGILPARRAARLDPVEALQ